ncbi:regulator of G-protein signaling 9 isoform X1 [Bombus vosnesenskii]|uniref:Regulator of G-protein signaling 9 isoform X1 n=1 Tax=Bombus vosnesenskii TaxID=207650 RepID=A0A6J3KTS7_9HYME|nr:regulator of G-protein signaling 9 isoform X1 [Bombus vosnesenskii]XP_033356468.1 regulator of G-protein signaling 9 isoform X1 [Bombus vosnesenskii]XP_033356469.1 regulator of G-protein signaling 9 isoform X1 [Bombus vosnesenskii]XP_033356470.1 regulator of G-protein signaling 9 isoform X1 [Bombus vosnesenskii]XP_033356471.1 regulator of G-protein signaling 9 isoform X1 [Bombus vosnesenskii]
MEASNNQQQKKEPRVHRPYAFDKMEGLVREMQDPENGVPVRSQKQFLTSIPSAFMGECHRYLRCGVNVSGHHGQDTTVGCLRVAGYDLIEWLIERLSIEESVEAVHIANQLCQYGYFFPVNDSKTLTVRDDSSLYRFQTPCYWPWQHRIPDNVEYAIYLAKRTLRNKQRHALEDYEIEALNSLRRNLQNKWDIIQLQAEEQVRLAKERKKGDKIVSDSQERAFWRVYRPPPGCLSSLEVAPVPTRFRPGLSRPPSRKRTLTDLQREVALLKNSLTRTRIKVSAAIENLKSYFETYVEYDPMFIQPQPSNPWITDDQTFWQLNSPVVDLPTEKRVKRWALSMEELMSDPTGLQEFTNYLRKEYSHENIRFWLAVKDLRHSFQAQIPDKVNEIFKEFLAPGAPCEINIDGKTMEKVHQEMRNPNRFIFDSAAEHVYTLLLKKDCYPRFIRSDQYRNTLAAGVQPLQKKWFFSFGGQTKKKISSTSTSTSTPTPTTSILQHHAAGSAASGSKRRGSDRSLSGSAHELAVCGVRDTTSVPRVPHSHSQSNLTDIPYRGDLARLVKISTRPIPHSVQDAGTSETVVRPMDDVCPWDVVPGPSIEHAIDTTLSHHPISSGVTSSVESQAEEGNNLSAQLQSIEVTRASRKNSSQLDSCSSSSDVSLVVAEVSEHLRKSCSLQHSSSTAGMTTTERIGITTRNYSIGSTSGRTKLSEISRPSVLSYNYPSPQHSFEYSHMTTDRSDVSTTGKCIAEEPETSTTLKSLEEELTTKTLTKAPLISISAIVGDLPSDNSTVEVEEKTNGDHAPVIKEEIEIEERRQKPEADEGDAMAAVIAEESLAISALVKTETVESLEEAQVVPVWEPDPKQDDQLAPVTQPAPQQKRDNNVNEVCPWEDEENCRVDAPYVKTYATLGYL